MGFLGFSLCNPVLGHPEPPTELSMVHTRVRTIGRDSYLSCIDFMPENTHFLS